MKQTGKKLYELWEIYKDGKNGEVYEVAQCVVPSYIGEKVKVFTSEGNYKALVEADADVDYADSKSLVTMYGCLGTAKYRKVEAYKPITLSEAIYKLENYRTVYVSDDAGEIKTLCKYTDLEDVGIYTIADLMDANFYVKEPEVNVF